jgi:hypothetical protein
MQTPLAIARSIASATSDFISTRLARSGDCTKPIGNVCFGPGGLRTHDHFENVPAPGIAPLAKGARHAHTRNRVVEVLNVDLEEQFVVQMCVQGRDV